MLIFEEVIQIINLPYQLISSEEFLLQYSMLERALVMTKRYINVYSTTHEEIFVNYLTVNEACTYFYISSMPFSSCSMVVDDIIFSIYYDNNKTIVLIHSIELLDIATYVLNNHDLIQYHGTINDQVRNRLESFLLLKKYGNC